MSGLRWDVRGQDAGPTNGALLLLLHGGRRRSVAAVRRGGSRSGAGSLDRTVRGQITQCVSHHSRDLRRCCFCCSLYVCCGEYAVIVEV